MTRRSYNGFSPAVRRAASAVQAQAFAADPSLRAHTCRACDVTSSTHHIDQHLEDYDDPIGGIIGLCRWCHGVTHERYDAPDAAETYRRMIREGWTFPAARDYLVVYRAVRGDTLARHALGARPGPPRGPGILDEIAAGLFDPRTAA